MPLQNNPRIIAGLAALVCLVVVVGSWWLGSRYGNQVTINHPKSQGDIPPDLVPPSQELEDAFDGAKESTSLRVPAHAPIPLGASDQVSNSAPSQLIHVRESTLRGCQMRFERSSGPSRYVYAQQLLAYCTIVSLDIKAKWEPVNYIGERLISPERPLAGDVANADSTATMTIHSGYRLYRFQRREFPEYADCNDMSWRIRTQDGVVVEMDEDLSARVFARYRAALAVIQSAGG